MDMTCSRPIAGRARMRTSAAEEALHDPGLRSASRPRPFTGKEGVEALVLGVRASRKKLGKKVVSQRNSLMLCTVNSC